MSMALRPRPSTRTTLTVADHGILLDPPPVFTKKLIKSLFRKNEKKTFQDRTRQIFLHTLITILQEKVN